MLQVKASAAATTTETATQKYGRLQQKFLDKFKSIKDKTLGEIYTEILEIQTDAELQEPVFMYDKLESWLSKTVTTKAATKGTGWFTGWASTTEEQPKPQGIMELEAFKKEIATEFGNLDKVRLLKNKKEQEEMKAELAKDLKQFGEHLEEKHSTQMQGLHNQIGTLVIQLKEEKEQKENMERALIIAGEVVREHPAILAEMRRRFTDAKLISHLPAQSTFAAPFPEDNNEDAETSQANNSGRFEDIDDDNTPTNKKPESSSSAAAVNPGKNGNALLSNKSAMNNSDVLSKVTSVLKTFLIPSYVGSFENTDGTMKGVPKAKCQLFFRRYSLIIDLVSLAQSPESTPYERAVTKVFIFCLIRYKYLRSIQNIFNTVTDTFALGSILVTVPDTIKKLFGKYSDDQPEIDKANNFVAERFPNGVVSGQDKKFVTVPRSKDELDPEEARALAWIYDKASQTGFLVDSFAQEELLGVANGTVTRPMAVVSYVKKWHGQCKNDLVEPIDSAVKASTPTPSK